MKLIQIEPICGNLIRNPSFSLASLAYWIKRTSIFDKCQQLLQFKRIHKMMKDAIAHTEGLESPRVMKSHLPISIIPPDVTKTSKILVVMRNPKDACVSFFHHERLLPNHVLKPSYSFDDYAKMFMQGKVPYGDYWMFLKVKIF